jgi:aminoglycoside phosphotransferase (APT) family kinase protein
MTAPGESLAPLWRDLPRTLLHGDTKVANFAVLPDGRVSAFDWSFVGAGPATLDLGWYLAMNATRLARSKESVMERYRELLEEALGRTIPAGEWERMTDLAVWCGARSMLWSKALALESGRDGAEEEWQWWADRLGSAPLP